MSGEVDTTSTAERLLLTALESFAFRGVEASSLDEIAERSGVRKQTLLYHFTSKEGLLDAVIARTVEDLAQTVRDAIASSDDPHRGAVDALFRIGTQRPELLELVREVLRLGPPASQRLIASAEPFLNELGVALPRQRVLGAISIIIGLATEVDVAAALGLTPTLGDLRRRRRVLLHYLGIVQSDRR